MAEQKNIPQPMVMTNYTLDCSKCVQDSLFQASDLRDHLIEKIKIAGRTGQLGKKTLVSVQDNKVTIVSEKTISKRYIKYLAKKFLYSKKIKDWVRVIAADRDSYRFSYYNVMKDAEE